MIPTLTLHPTRKAPRLNLKILGFIAYGLAAWVIFAGLIIGLSEIVSLVGRGF